MRAKTLIQAWLEVELNINCKTLAEALRDLNKKLGSVHTHSRVREWEENRNGRGDRLPRKVRGVKLLLLITGGSPAPSLTVIDLERSKL